MRRMLTKKTLHQFMRELGTAARSPGKVYLTGGATALLLGFREQTLDVDLKMDPEPAGAFEAIAKLKDRLDVVGSSRVDLQACKLEYSIVSPK